MSTGTQTPVDRLTYGTRFIPTGKKQIVEAISIEDHAGFVLVAYLTRTGGGNVCRLSKYDTVETFPPVFA